MSLLGLARIIESESSGNTKKSRGSVGEHDVEILLKKFILRNNFYAKLIHDYRMSYRGKKAQIDFILIFCKGIFVIEVKNWEGLVCGNYEDEYWTRTYRGTEHTYLNPLFQNCYHISLLKEATGLDEFFHSLVVFASNNASRLNINSVVSITKMNNYLSNFKSEVSLSNEMIDGIYRMLTNK